MSNYIAFATKKEAVKYLRSIDYLYCTNPEGRGDCFTHSGPYVSSHGEYNRPYYTVRRYKDGWGIHAEYYYYNNVYNAPTDGRVNIYNVDCYDEYDEHLNDIHPGNYFLYV